MQRAVDEEYKRVFLRGFEQKGAVYLSLEHPKPPDVTAFSIPRGFFSDFPHTAYWLKQAYKQ